MLGFLVNKKITKTRLILLKIFNIMVESGLNVQLVGRLHSSMDKVKQQNIIKRNVDVNDSIGGKVSSLKFEFLGQLFYFVAYSYAMLGVVLLLECIFYKNFDRKLSRNRNGFLDKYFCIE